MEIDWLLASVQVLCPGCLIQLSQQPHEGDYKAPLLYSLRLNTVSKDYTLREGKRVYFTATPCYKTLGGFKIRANEDLIKYHCV